MGETASPGPSSGSRIRDGRGVGRGRDRPSLDYDSRAAHLFTADGTHRMLGVDDELAIPELLGKLRVPVQTFFD
jgi:hypothetical protein